ncbi:hypothetical protein BS50DRAFT_565045 [Corynespora cassiicola Philippines]|uniref:SprT-like domain-containing protein n=1 Tax=Corynespora cassiicola Philippines TaxID=1448308 RepID=A0A2T2N2Q8_CORCC|nr:hypothetical protein BS50DRAFT_565045 [Corynespora cassiicola Philippines]
MPPTDEDAATAAIAALETLSRDQRVALDAIHAILRDGQPFVDIHDLFGHYNVLYFRGLLVPRVDVSWSPRLTLCAGICELSKDPSTGNFTRIRLKLSTPLLQYRPRSDTINTLLHEAIHAYLFVTTSWQHSRGDDGTGHGVGFQLLADAINNHGHYDITVFHTFHDEVDSYRTHVWQCNGPCKTRPPYFGLVKRSMNRPPGKSDTWWATHETDCGGTYTKIQEPAPTKKQLESMSKKERAGRQKNKIDGWVKREASGDAAEGKTTAKPIDPDGAGQLASARQPGSALKTEDVAPSGQKRTRAEGPEGGGEVSPAAKKTLVECPICAAKVIDSEINAHLDTVHDL